MSTALHVEQSASGGAAVPLVMLHGWGMNLRVFDGLRAALAPLPTWAIDLPGHGRSPWWPGAADFRSQCDAVLAALPPRCVLLGWSLGAQVALALAARAPARIDALVLLSPTPRFTHAADWPHGVQARVLHDLRDALARDWRQVLEDFVWLQVRGGRDADATARTLLAALAAHGAPDTRALLAGLQVMGELDLRDAIDGIAQPTLVVTGLNDRVTLPGAARWLAQELPAARLLELPRAGHAPFLSHHAEVGAALRDFLAGAARRSEA